jgi:hypothetical protein
VQQSLQGRIEASPPTRSRSHRLKAGATRAQPPCLATLRNILARAIVGFAGIRGGEPKFSTVEPFGAGGIGPNRPINRRGG